MRSLPVFLIIALAAFVTWAFPQEAVQEGSQQVAKHWSPYSYPTTFPPGSRIHLIADGDTLWDISTRYYNNPLVWPHLHSANQYISNPDLIYPGDPLILPELSVAESGRVVEEQKPETAETAQPQEGQADQEKAETEPGEQPQEQDQQELTPEQMAAAQQRTVFRTQPRPTREYALALSDLDLYCSSVVYPKRPKSKIWIIGSEEKEQIEISQYDIVYLNYGRDKLKPGDLFIAATYHGPVRHPDTSRRVGYAYQENGILEVILTARDYSVAEVKYACDGLTTHSLLLPVGPRPNAVFKIRRVLSKLEQYEELPEGRVGTIVYVNYSGFEAGGGDVVNIDLGAHHGLKSGDRCTILRIQKFRAGRHLKRPESPKPKNQEEFNQYLYDLIRYASVHRVLGEGVVFRVLETTASLKITYCVDFVNVGERILAVPALDQEAAGR